MGGEGEVGERPFAAPVILRAVELGGAHPVLAGERGAVVNAQPALLGRVDEEQAAERPPGLTAQARLRLLFDDDDVLARVDEFGSRDEPGETGSDDQGVGAIRHRLSFRSWGPARC